MIIKGERAKDMEEQILKTGKGKVFYWRSDNWDVSKGTLFFLHGLTADHSMFDWQIPAFGKEYNLLTWDTPAHGKSRPFAEFDFSDTLLICHYKADNSHHYQALLYK